MAQQDRYGLTLSTASAEAASAYREGVDLLLAAWPGAAEAFERAIAADPDFALAHIARARIHTFYQQGDVARKKAALARELVARNGSERERTHVETLALAIEGQIPAALACALTHLEAHPRDAIVMSLPLGAFGLFAFSGMADHDQARVDLCGRYAHHYGDDWWFLTNHGWALTENGDVRRGRAMTRARFRHAQGQRATRRMRCCTRCSRTGRSRMPIAWSRSGSRPTTVPASCTATSSGIRRSARSSMAMRPARWRSMPTC